MKKAYKIKTIALVDLYWEGHYLTYLKTFAKTLLELGCDLIVLCPQPVMLNDWIENNCPEYKKNIYVYEMSDPKLSKIEISKIRSIINIVRRWKKTASILRNVSKETGKNPELVFFAALDDFLEILIPTPYLNWIFPYKWSGLYLQPINFRLHKKCSFIRKGLLDRNNLFSSKLCRSVAVLDEGIITRLQKKIKSKTVSLFPDFADNSVPDIKYAVANEIRKISHGRKIVGLLGALQKRKGILTLLNLAQKYNHEDWFFIFCGKIIKEDFTPEELNYIDTIKELSPDNCYFYNDYIPSETQFNALVELCDVIFSVYEDFYYSSNMLAKAAYFKKWVIVNNGFCMYERVRQFQLGLSVESGDIKGCYEALRHLLNNDIDLHPNYKGYLDLHSEQRLKDAFECILDQQ
jgi:hypothetical protein